MALNTNIVDMELDKKCLFIEEKHMKLENKEEGEIKDDSHISGLRKSKRKRNK